MKGGITGKILWVNLATGTHEVLEPAKDLYQQYLGGYGIGVKLIYEKQKPGLPPCPLKTFWGSPPAPSPGHQRSVPPATR